jgi:hypothetical protein
MARDEQLRELHREVARRDRTIEWLHAEVRARDEKVTWLHEEVAARDGAVERLTTALAQRQDPAPELGSGRAWPLASVYRRLWRFWGASGRRETGSSGR